jgi:hypothetical protein
MLGKREFLAGETEGKAARAPTALLSAITDRLITREVAIAIALAVLTFAAYWFLGPKETPYPFQVSQANNLIHGHLDLKPEHTVNITILEQVLYDGERFCISPSRPERVELTVEYAQALEQGQSPDEARRSIISQSCKTYMQHSLGPAFVVLPGVLVWGKELNQTLVSVVIGSLTAIVVYAISRRLTKNPISQVALTVLMMFGTLMWFAAANGGVWFFAHTMAVFFMFGAIYFTLVRRSPFLAGLFFSAAFMSRPTVLVSGLFFVVMFSDLWLRPQLDGRSLLSRINLRPLAELAVGAAPLILVNMALNYARYDSPFETGYSYVESAHQTLLAPQYVHGTLDMRYLERHPPVIFGAMPVVQQAAPYVLPSWIGLAIWATTPAFAYAFFANLKKHIWVVVAGAVALTASAAFMLSRAIARAWNTDWATADAPLDVHMLPFWVMTAVAVAAAIYYRDRLTIASWAAIIPIALIVFMFAVTGHAQFGYRYGLDFYPLLWLLVARTFGDKISWHHLALIAVSVAVNLWGVLWIYQFQPDQAFGVTQWVTF